MTRTEQKVGEAAFKWQHSEGDTRCKLLALYVESEPTNLAGTGGGLSAETVQALESGF